MGTLSGPSQRCLGWAGAAVVLAAPTLAYALAVAPEAACGLLADQGLRARGGYEKTGAGVYLCSSRQVDLPAGDPVRHRIEYLASGTEQQVTRLTLKLDVRSRAEVQRAFHILLGHASALTERALGQGLPDAAQASIRAGTPGRWEVGGTAVALERLRADSQVVFTVGE